MIGAALLIAVLLALNIGANNAGTTVGGIVGARIWPRRRAAVLAGLAMALGAVTLGAPVAHTMGTAFLPPGPELAILVPLIAAAILQMANLAGVPTSTTLAVVAPAVGLGLASGTLNEARAVEILIWWTAGPVLAAVVAYALWRFIDSPAGGFLRTRRRAWTHVAAAGALYLAFSAGANNVGNVAGPVSSLLPGAVVGGAVALALGASLLSGRVVQTVGGGLTRLCRVRAALVTLISGSVALAASRFGVPISITALVAGSLVGISLASRGWRRTVASPDVRRTAAVWGASPAVGVLLAYAIGGVL